MSLYLSAVTLLLALALWLGATAVTLAVATVVVLRLPVTYFSEDDAAHAARAATWRSPRGLGRNALGVILILLGVLLAVPGVPGQGLLMVLVGLMLVDFPGRRRLEKALARRHGILATLNRLRARFGRPPLLPPPA
ncbi:MAG TPA: hypothetical protein VE932_20875 [Patescibacteria group bacterium]|nr:hypothetical protein [Patescibacteria group bacterium]